MLLPLFQLLRALLLLLLLLQFLPDRHQEHQALNSSSQKLPGSSLLGCSSISQQNLHHPDNPPVRRKDPYNFAQAIGRSNFCLIPYKTDVPDLEILVPLRVLELGVGKQ